MRKRLLSSVAALVFACSLVPSVALAGEGDETTIPVTIEIGAGGAPAGTSGDGWTYENDVLVLETGYAFTFAGGTFDASGEDRVWNSGIIVDGTFVDESKGYGSAVRNETSGVIQGGTFTASVANAGAIEDGTFNDRVKNEGSIQRGEFNGTVQNVPSDVGAGIIAGGTFSSTGTVANNDEDTTDDGGTISGGTFAGPVTNGDPDPDWNAAAITGGTFAGAVTNYDAIGGGAFSSIVSNKEGGTVSSGMSLGDVTNRGVVEGGFFARPIIIGEGGTVSSCTFPVNASLAGLSLAGTGAEQPVATYEKDGEESNCLTLTADTGYTLPSSVSVRLGSADGRGTTPTMRPPAS